MNPSWLQELKEAEAAATQGPWSNRNYRYDTALRTIDQGPCPMITISDCHLFVETDTPSGGAGWFPKGTHSLDQGTHDATAITLLRNAAPRLIRIAEAAAALNFNVREYHTERELWLLRASGEQLAELSAALRGDVA